jgi:hypothetical protein
MFDVAEIRLFKLAAIIVLMFLVFALTRHYDTTEAKAAAEALQIKQLADLNQANARAADTERKYNELRQQDDARSIQRQASTVAAADHLATVAHTRGLWLRANCPTSTKLSPATSTASAIAVESADVRLSDEAGNFLRAESRRADDAANYGQAAHDYAVTIQKFIDAQKVNR